MSALTQNKQFLSGVLAGKTLDFDADVFGLWVSVFENVNHSANGYSYPKPLVQDFTAIDYAITGKKLSLFNYDGEYPNVRFFITSGKKGSDEYTEIVADITNTFVTGIKPLVIMPDMDFAGKLYRKYEVTGLVKSLYNSSNILSVSGEDWSNTAIAVQANGSDEEYGYYDTQYSGYSNEVTARYKFLYDDEANSIEKNISTFEIPTQIEDGANIRYRISRKSDPLGSYFSPQVTADGKVIVDYSFYKDEVSGVADSSVNYDFQQTAKFVFPKRVFADLEVGETVVRPINDAYITGIQLTRKNENDLDLFSFKLLTAGNYSDIYKVSFNLDRFNSITKSDVVGYVLTGIQIEDGSPKVVIDIGVNSGVYPRVIQSTKYNSQNLLDLVNTDELVYNEQVAQENAATLSYGDEDSFATNLRKDFENRQKIINDLLKDDFTSLETLNDTEITTTTVDDLEVRDLNTANANPVTQRFILPIFPLPKENVDKEYFSNYINSGEEYIVNPLVSYNLNTNYVYYGNQYGQLGYYIEEGEEGAKTTRTVVNSTCNGIYIKETGLCVGDSATFANMPYVEDLYILNGQATNIPSNGIISKENFTDKDSWSSAINYFYNKNYLSSCDIFPTDTAEGISVAVKNALSQALANVKVGIGEFASAGNGKDKDALIYVEREIYVEPFDSDQIGLFNNVVSPVTGVAGDFELNAGTLDKLYAVQTFDTEFAASNEMSPFFFNAKDYQESVTFSLFLPYKDAQGNQVLSYATGENYGTVYSRDITTQQSEMYRLEYVTGDSFTYSNLSASSAWNGLNNASISITNQDEKNYGYHLYGYNNSTDELTFVKANVKTGDSASTGKTNAVVLKFTKKAFAEKTYIRQDELNSYRAMDISVTDSNGVMVDQSKVFFNLQKYTYEAKVLTSDDNKSIPWYTNKQNPINDDNYGADNALGLVIPRFFQDSPQEAITMAETLLTFPNGASTSKNYEGVPVDIGNINAFADGALNNTLKIKEANSSYLLENDFILNFTNSGRLSKEEGLTNITNFSLSRRLKISRVKYNFYIKDLVIIGDAGFPYSIELNTGWEYKLQYRVKEGEWKEMESSSSLGNNKIQAISSFLNPYFYKLSDLSTPNYLSMVGFVSNISRYLDDNNYEFRIFKYQKLISPSDSVNVLRKTNFLPVKVDWTWDGLAEYFNIYQVDANNNYKLLGTETQSKTTSYVIPSVKQASFDEGVTNFPVNGDGYYNIIASGALPLTAESQVNASVVFNGAKIGNDGSDGQLKVNVIQNVNSTQGFNPVSNVVYTPLINFNNPESKTSDFEINSNYSGYYFISNSKNATVTSSFKDMEFYVANVGASQCSLIDSVTTTIPANNVAEVKIYPTVTTTSISSLPSSQADVSNGEFLYLKNNASINASDFSSGSLISFYATIINDSASTITVSYGTTSVNIEAKKTKKLNFSNGWTSGSSYSPTITENIVYQNVEAQTSYISSKDSLVNLNYELLELQSKDYSELPVYNFSNDKLSVNGDIDLDGDSFYLVNWNGLSSPFSTPTATKKKFFDSIKIFIKGTESENDSIFVLKDDTEIDITNFRPNSLVGQDKIYFFLKDDAVGRALNLKIINDSEEVLLPRGSEDFKLTVKKTTSGGIEYAILYPSNDFSTVITDTREQLIVIKTDGTEIDVGYIESALKSNAFVYFVNRSSTDVLFRKNFIEQVFTLGTNKIARVVLQKGSGRAIISEITDSLNHFAFSINPSTHLADPSSINILNLKFCGTEISMPSVSSFVNENTFLIFKNRFSENKIDEVKVSQKSSSLLDKDLIQQNCRILSVVKENASDKVPTINRLEVDNINSSLIFKEPKTSSNSFYDNDSVLHDFNVFYIKDSGLSNFTISDFYARKNRYSGKIFTSTNRQITFSSFDEIYPQKTLAGRSFDFDFDLGDTPDGALSTNAAEKDFRIFNSDSEDNGLKTLSDLKASHLCVNFSYNYITLTTGSATVYKNRVIDENLNIYPIYNKEEFFISQSQEQELVSYQSGKSYFYDIVFSTDVNQIILPKPFATQNKYIFNNLSSKPVAVKLISNNSTIVTLNPNSKYTLSIVSGAWASAAYNSSTDGALQDPSVPLLILKQNQNQEIDANHPFKDLWPGTGYSQSASQIEDSISNGFKPDSNKQEKENLILNNSISYTIVDASVDLTVNTNTNNATAGDPTVFCFGRRGPTITLSDSDLYVLNDFYLYFLCQGAADNNEFLSFGQVWGNKFIPFQNPPSSAVYIERINQDVGAFFKPFGGPIDISEIKNVTMVPFYREATSFYLPNLSVTVKVNDEIKTLGQVLLDKQIVFVNLVANDISSPNKIYNYSNVSPNTNITLLNSVVLFKVVLDGSDYIWQKQTSNIPQVQNCYPSIINVTGVTDQTCANVTDGNEFIYLQNIDTFELNLDSFKNKQFQNFYIYNSCSYPIKVIKDGVTQSTLTSSLAYLNKVSYDGAAYSVIGLQYNGSTDFVETELLQITNSTQEKINARATAKFPSPSKDAYLKLNYYDSSVSSKYFSLFKTEIEGDSYVWKEVDLPNIKEGNVFNAILDIKDLEDYSSDNRLFIYGSSVRNESDYIFDNYTLNVKNASQRSSSFFIFNNTIRDMLLVINDISVVISPTRMAEIYRSGSGVNFKYCETHQKGKFYISYRDSNKNYLQRQNTKLYIDAVRTLNLESGASLLNGEELSATRNCIISLLATNAEVCYFDKAYFPSTSSGESLQPILLQSSYSDTGFVYDLATIRDFSAGDLGPQYLLLKPFCAISSSGHFIVSNNNNFIKLTPTGSDTFLVNNTSENIYVQKSGVDLILYRNTVLVVNSSRHRYLKKSKSRDEFYSVFNPKTIVSTQREISQVLQIEKQQQILPINNLDFIEQISYLILFSKTGQQESVYLNLQDYYYGQDIPSDCPTDMVAYEIGIGHETIYKFLFFDPVDNYYTLPGIAEGVEYEVDINEGLFYNLNLGENIDSANFGSVRYMNKKYSNGDTFIGGKSSWYEVDFPNYVRVYKVVREIPPGFVESYSPEDESGISTADVVDGEDIDPLAKFKELIFSTISNKLSTSLDQPAALCWLPENQSAFWLDSNFVKDIWQVTSVDQDSVVKITQTENSQTKELSFVKCTMRKNSLRSPVYNYHYEFYSALQEKIQMSDTGEVSMGFDYNLTPAQRGKLRRIIIGEYGKDDYLYSDGPFEFGTIIRENLLQTSSSSPSQVKNSSFEITINLEKIKTMPNIKVEDFSFDPTVKLLNESI
jgi:hypothetical protein